MKRRIALVAIVLLAIGAADAAPRLDAQAPKDEPGAPRAHAPVTFLQINDVYTTVPVDGFGGLAKLSTLKQQFTAAGRTPFLVLAGDFLSPSVASTVFKGEQMVAALNAIPIDLATLGNHEFDFGDDLLIQRMHEAKLQWVVSNVIDRRTNKPIAGAAPYLVKTFGTLKVGFIGLCLNTSEIAAAKLTHTTILDPVAAAGAPLAALRRQGVQVIVAVTHLAFETDRALVERYPQIDLVIGGHEHFPITSTENRTLISKAGSDAKFVARIDVDRQPPRTLERFYELMPITSAIPDDPAAAAVVNSYESKLGAELDVVVGRSTEPLDAVSVRMRASETNIGDLVADALRDDAKADVAIMNSGSIRGDRIYPAGPLKRRDLVAMLPFGNVTCVVAVPGRIVLDALNHGVSALPAANGWFPQISCLTMTVDASAPVGNRVRDVRVAGQPLDPAKTYTLAIPDFVLKGGDGYTMFAGQKVIVTPEAGTLMVAGLEKYVAAKGAVAPVIDHRITIR